MQRDFLVSAVPLYPEQEAKYLLLETACLFGENMVLVHTHTLWVCLPILSAVFKDLLSFTINFSHSGSN